MAERIKAAVLKIAAPVKVLGFESFRLSFVLRSVKDGCRFDIRFNCCLGNFLDYDGHEVWRR